VCCAGSGLCDKPITHSEESYWLCVSLTVCDLETSTMRQPRPELGRSVIDEKEMMRNSKRACDKVLPKYTVIPRLTSGPANEFFG
jgi:hypothetical protein